MTYFLITVAVEGHTDENSTDVCTVAGTSDRKIRTPKLRETLFSRCGQQVDRWHAKSAASSPMTAHWGIHDPAAVEGTDDEKLRAFNKAFRELDARLKSSPAYVWKCSTRCSSSDSWTPLARCAKSVT